MTARPASFNKHQGLIVSEGIFEPKEPSYLSKVSEALFGKSESAFEASARQFKESRNRKSEGHGKKLGAGVNFATILKNQDGLMWTGEIYMGKLTKMDVVYDTGSDWLTVEGMDCSNCEGNTYDIGPSLDGGIATLVETEQSTRAYGSATL